MLPCVFVMTLVQLLILPLPKLIESVISEHPWLVLFRDLTTYECTWSISQLLDLLSVFFNLFGVRIRGIPVAL